MNEYEKSVFLTQAQDELVKNHFSSASRGNSLQQGYDDSLKRQTDFSGLMKTSICEEITDETLLAEMDKIDYRSTLWTFPKDVFIVINEALTATSSGTEKPLQVVDLRYDEYTRLMSKPYKRPLKNQAWRLINSGNASEKYVELVTNIGDDVTKYKIRYIRTLKPIILADLDGLTIEGIGEPTECELDPSLHQELLTRAVELAKAAWVTTNSGENIQLLTQSGQRSE